MIEDSYTCEICLETYDLKSKTKMPKTVPCCGNTFCLACLEDIYTRNGGQFVCPFCRRVSSTRPKHFITNSKVSSRFLECCNCKEVVAQSQLYLNYENNKMKIKCEKCQNEDLKLYDCLPEFVSELNTFLNKNRVTDNNDLFIILENKVKEKLTTYFNKIIQDMTALMTKKIIDEIKNNYYFDLREKYNKFKEDITQLYYNYKYLHAFINDDQTQNFKSKKILECMEFYNNNIHNFQKDIELYDRIRTCFNSSNLFYLRNNLSINKLSDFFLELLDTAFTNPQVEKENEKKQEKINDLLFNEEIDKNIELNEPIESGEINDKLKKKKEEEEENFNLFSEGMIKERKISLSELDNLIISPKEESDKNVKKKIMKIIQKKPSEKNFCLLKMNSIEPSNFNNKLK